jgi:hypothetical protein
MVRLSHESVKCLTTRRERDATRKSPLPSYLGVGIGVKRVAVKLGPHSRAHKFWNYCPSRGAENIARGSADVGDGAWPERGCETENEGQLTEEIAGLVALHLEAKRRN